MISTLKEVREALNSALDESDTRLVEYALTKLDALIAATEKAEPVGYVGAGYITLGEGRISESQTDVYKVPVYIAPQSAAEPHVPETNFGNIEPLTEIDCEFSAMNPLCEESIFDLAGNYDCGMREENQQWQFTSQRQLLLFVRAIEAAHGIGAKP